MQNSFASNGAVLVKATANKFAINAENEEKY